MFFDGIKRVLLSHQTAIVLDCIMNVEIGEAELEAMATFQDARCAKDARQGQR